MPENVLLKSILDDFIEKLKLDTTIPRKVISDIEALRSQNKIAKGTNLKALIESSTDEAENET